MVVRLRLMRLTGQWLDEHELTGLLEGPLGPRPQPRPDDDWRFRSFEQYFPMPPSRSAQEEGESQAGAHSTVEE